MPVAWFICKYKRRTVPPNSWWKLHRYCAMDDFTSQINADGGAWSETEILNGYAIVKVRASDTTLDTIAGTTGFQRLPKRLLTASLSDLTSTQKNAIRNKLEEIGYPLSEIRASLGNDLGNKTLADVLKFAAKRRLLHRLDEATDTVIYDGIEQPVKPVDAVDKAVT